MKRISTWFALLALSVAVGARAQPPNVLFIAVDDLNDWVGCLGGHPQSKTPHIDRLAKRGILFTNAHCASPACNPSRAAVFSGMMPWNTGVWSNASKRLFQQHPNAKVLPRAFSDAGYTTLGTGKLMHSSGSANRVMFDQHFSPGQRWSPFSKNTVAYTDDELPSKGSNHPRHLVTVEGNDPVVLPLNGMPSDRNPTTPGGESFDWGPLDVPDSAMGDTQIADWAIEKLNSPTDKPFFLGVGFYRPHIPLWAPKKYFDRLEGQRIELPPSLKTDLDDLGETGRRFAIEAVTAGLHQSVVQHRQWQDAIRAYLACTTFVDAQIGRLLDTLDDSPFGDNTVIVLWSDHGWHLGEKQHWGKWTPWERSTRVLLAVVPPKRWAAKFENLGRLCDEPVSLIDLYPTLAELCNVPVPESLDGRSLVPLLHDPGLKTERVSLTSFGVGNVSIRSDRWRYIRYNDATEELYDQSDDPNEWVNLANEPASEPVLRSFRTRTPLEAIQPTD